MGVWYTHPLLKLCSMFLYEDSAALITTQYTTECKQQYERLFCTPLPHSTRYFPGPLLKPCLRATFDPRVAQNFTSSKVMYQYGTRLLCIHVVLVECWALWAVFFRVTKHGTQHTIPSLLNYDSSSKFKVVGHTCLYWASGSESTLLNSMAPCRYIYLYIYIVRTYVRPGCPRATRKRKAGSGCLHGKHTEWARLLCVTIKPWLGYCDSRFGLPLSLSSSKLRAQLYTFRCVVNPEKTHEFSC